MEKIFTLDDLQEMETIHSGQYDNLKFDNGKIRVWLSRCGIEDGMPFNNAITVEKLIDGRWETIEEYAG